MGVAKMFGILFLSWLLALELVRLEAKRDVRKLVFDDDGRFKIAQFADLHFGEAENTLWGPLQDVVSLYPSAQSFSSRDLPGPPLLHHHFIVMISWNSTRVMEHVLAWERPKLVIYSGDQVTGENINNNATAYWGRLLQPCLNTDTPWATVFGNHDDRSVSGGTRRDLLTFDTSFNLSLSQFGPSSVHGLTNYYLLLYSNEKATIPSWVIYFLDSGGGTYPELVYPDQITWFNQTASDITQTYGPIPALAFFHIPSTGYEDVYQKSLCFGMDDDDVTPQIEPNGLLSVLGRHGVVWVSVGHDHGNDWCCPSPAGPTVCYGRHTGYGGYGRWARGSRLTVLNRYSVTTYVRMENGSIIDGNNKH